MKFILHTPIGEQSVERSLGRAEYSYFFVMKAFRPALERVGKVVVVENPATDVDPLYEEAVAAGEACVHLSFTPPHRAPVALKCPTVSILAWEFSNIPDEVWGDDPRSDWRYVLGRHGRTIVLSSYTAEAVRVAMGADFPVAAIAAPVWIGNRPDYRPARPWVEPIELVLRGLVADSRAGTTRAIPDPEPPPEEIGEPELVSPESAPTTLTMDAAEPEPSAVAVVEPEPSCLDVFEPAPVTPVPVAPVTPPRNIRYRLGVTKRHALEWYREALKDLMPRPIAIAISRSGGWAERATHCWLGPGWRPPALVEVPPPPPPPPPLPPVDPPPPAFGVTLGGVVYTSVFNPTDGRKNWVDLVTGFCWAFRDVDDAVLVLKTIHVDARAYLPALDEILGKLSPFKCRVVTVQSFLAEADYRRLVEATSFYVNCSHCEGLCLPLMEFMAAGRPVIAPLHTAMADYVDTAVGFTVDASLENNVWPHDPRELFRTLRYRLNWGSLLTAFRESYRVAKAEPDRYAVLGAAARERMRRIASVETVEAQLRAFFAADLAAPMLPSLPAVAPIEDDNLMAVEVS
ncbi:hypothetical protein GCM10011611_61880 [Aliidongia dinghuensis]|uniref:Glycosyltransferase n=1 Tax=Aliidongia dinghuensis TaxID=1867774 RepID=A0A8J2YZS1_9PROT|nr:glycosyltransferase [Aliidongia dinghuensis]GGF47091.1 hypothetical protein GCM10011611_61880 [Aliidongia dinghuensis]